MGPIYKMGSLKELLALDPNKPVMLDTETETLYSEIRLIQVYQEGMEQALLFDVKMSRPSVEIIWDVLVDYHLVLHNGLYDLFCFQADVEDFRMPKRWDDTFYASRLVKPHYGKHSLDFVMTQVLGYDPYFKEELNKKELQLSFEVTDKKPRVDLTESQLIYAATDVYYLPAVWNEVKQARELFVYDLDIKTAEYQVKIYPRGCPIDRDKLNLLRKNDNIKVFELTKKLPMGLNVNSYIQVRKVLGLENSSNELTLMMIAHRPNGVEGVTMNVKDENGEWQKEPLEENYEHTAEKEQIALTILAKRKALKRLNFNDRALANGRWCDE